MWQKTSSWTRSLCAETWKLLCLNLLFHSLPPPSFFPFSPTRAPPTQLLNGKVCLLPAFTQVSIYSKLLSLSWDASQLFLWGGLQLMDSHVHWPSEYSTSPPQLQREPSQWAHELENACGLINSISRGKDRYILPMWCRKIPWKHTDRWSPINPLWVVCYWRHVTVSV